MIEVLEMIPKGKENAISRKELADRLNCSDRKARDIIHSLKCHFPILSNTTKGGYYRPATIEEANEYNRQLSSYVKQVNKTKVPIQRWITKQKRIERAKLSILKDQVNLFGLERCE